jgi:hypothetical protein
MPVLITDSPALQVFVWYDTMTVANGQVRQDYAYRYHDLAFNRVTYDIGSASSPYRSNRDTLFVRSNPTREDTMLVTHRALRSNVTDTTGAFCATGRCTYVFRRLD